MLEKILNTFRKGYNKVIFSIAFIPACIAFAFLLLGILVMELDILGWGANLNNRVKWLKLKDAETARTIATTVVAGIISLTVFSFSMVMIVMNQAASQMSNRILDQLTGNKAQKVVLGFYIGTVMFALLLLINISNTDTEASIPVLSVYLLMLLSVIDLFLFVFFLHYITESIKYGQLIHRIHNKTSNALEKHVAMQSKSSGQVPAGSKRYEIVSPVSGYFQGFDEKLLTKVASQHDVVIQFLETQGTYILKETPFLNIISKKDEIDTDLTERTLANIDFYYGQNIEKNPYYGFMHLMEVGVKALSPGINDPGTAVLSLHALTDLLAYRMHHTMPSEYYDENGNLRIITKERSFAKLFEISVFPIWHYGKNDIGIQAAILQMIKQLQTIDKENEHDILFQKMVKKVEENRL